MKGALALRPVFHHREDRIRAHVQLCWLALLLIRVAENSTGQTWHRLHQELDRLHLVTLATGSGTVAQRSATHPEHKAIWAALDLPEPPASSTSPPPRAADQRPAPVVTRPHPGLNSFRQVNPRIWLAVCS